MKKKNLIAVIAIAVAAVILIGVLIWQLGGNDPVSTDPTETSTSSTEQGSAGETTAPDETTAPTETTEPEETQPEETEAPTDTGETEPVETEPPVTEPAETEPVETEPPVTEPAETEPVETEPVETEPPATEPTVTFTEVNETVYATRTVNVRKGPSSNTEKLGSMEAGTAILRVGIGSNGWSKVIYNGEEAYIFTNYLSKEMPVVEKSEETQSAKDKDDKTDSSEDKKEDDDVIIYTYPDGTTGTEPMEGATYELKPGVIVTWYAWHDEGMTEEEKADADKGIFHCDYCGRVDGDGSNGTCVRWMTGGEHTCPSCGATVPEYTCHNCDEN